MQISVIRKLMHPIKSLLSPRAKKSSEATSELREESKMQSAECRMQNESLLTGEVVPEVTEMSLSTDEEAALPDDPYAATADYSEKATATEEIPSSAANTKAHLSSSVPRAAKIPQSALTKSEMAEIRSIFGDMDDTEIQRLYKRVTKTN